MKTQTYYNETFNTTFFQMTIPSSSSYTSAKKNILVAPLPKEDGKSIESHPKFPNKNPNRPNTNRMIERLTEVSSFDLKSFET
jgi:hypothetical protein